MQSCLLQIEEGLTVVTWTTIQRWCLLREKHAFQAESQLGATAAYTQHSILQHTGPYTSDLTSHSYMVN